MAGRGPFRRRDLLMPLVAGELVTEDFLLNEASRTIGEPVLEEPERSMDWLLIVRSKGSEMAETGKFWSVVLLSSSGKRENQSLLAMEGSPWNMGEHSKLSFRKGESPMSGEVRLVNAVEGGADPKASAKMSLGETVRVEPAVWSLMAVKAATWSKLNAPDWKPGIRLAPESKELLLFKSAMFVAWGCWVCVGMLWMLLLLELENKGTGGYWRNRGCLNSVVDEGAEFA